MEKSERFLVLGLLLSLASVCSAANTGIEISVKVKEDVPNHLCARFFNNLEVKGKIIFKIYIDSFFTSNNLMIRFTWVLGHIKFYNILEIVQKYINKDKQGQARTYQEIVCPLPICNLFDTVKVSFLVYSKSKTEIGVILLWSLYYDKILH